MARSKQQFDVDIDLYIDPENIDVEWAELPMLIHKYGQALAIADKRAREAEETVKTIRSELILEINDDPESFGLPSKPTGAVTEAAYRKDGRFTEAKRIYNRAQYEADSLRNVSYCLSAKRTALENLTRLISMEFYSSESLNEKLDQRREAREVVKKSLKKNKRRKGGK